MLNVSTPQGHLARAVRWPALVGLLRTLSLALSRQAAFPAAVVLGPGVRCSATDALELLLWLDAGLCQAPLFEGDVCSYLSCFELGFALLL